MSAEITEATPSTFRSFMEKNPDWPKDLPLPSMRAWIMKDGDVDLALAGLIFNGGRWYIFIEIRPEGRKKPLVVVRAGKIILAEAKMMGIKYIYASQDTEEKNSGKLLKMLGFVDDPRGTPLKRWRG